MISCVEFVKCLHRTRDRAQSSCYTWCTRANLADVMDVALFIDIKHLEMKLVSSENLQVFVDGCGH